MINALRINESVAAEMQRYMKKPSLIDEIKKSIVSEDLSAIKTHISNLKGMINKATGAEKSKLEALLDHLRSKVKTIGVDESEDEKNTKVQIPHKPGHYQFTFKSSKGKDAKTIRRIIKGSDMNKVHDDAKAQALKDYPESHSHVCHSPQTDESIKAREPKLITEAEDEKEGLEDKQFDAPTGAAIDDFGKKPEGVDQAHDEAGEKEDDPTREKLETPQDEEDEQKGGAAELAADLRVSVRIEKMNMGRYKKMLDKHGMSESGQAWLKEKIDDIQSTIDDMLEKIPELEKEAEADKAPAEVKAEIKEHMKIALRKAIVEIAG